MDTPDDALSRFDHLQPRAIAGLGAKLGLGPEAISMNVTVHGITYRVTKADIGRELYARALQADQCYTATLLTQTGRERWTMDPEDEAIPVVQRAYRNKVKADTEWLVFNRW